MFSRALSLALATSASVLAADPPEPRFRHVTLDARIQIGYGVAVADVDGDKAPDVLLADKKQIVWYRNPGADQVSDAAAWQKFVIAEDLTVRDNVCLAAADLDGDGKCEVAVGAEWNPGDTEKSGAVFYLNPPADRTQRWEPIRFPTVEPTTHRMKWLKLEDGTWGLVVAPLHGRGNKNGEGAGVKVLVYRKPADPKASEWASEVISDSLHLTHNFDLIPLYPEPALVLAGKEGCLGYLKPKDGEWSQGLAASAKTSFPAGEVRFGLLYRSTFIATVEPMHGNTLAIYHPFSDGGRRVLTDQLTEGHALAMGDLLGMKTDQIVVGWRGNPDKPRPVGIKLFTPLDEKGEKWRESSIDENEMACEDLVLADLNGDGKLDVIASGRSTRNVKLYLNESK